MSKRRRRGRTFESDLGKMRWTVPGGAVVTVSPPLYADLQETAAWGEAREPELRHWNWHSIAAAHAERFAVRADDRVIALWAGAGVQRMGEQLWYSLDFLEVAPDRRGSGTWGLMTMALVSGRGRECGATGLVLGAVAQRAAWYRRLGASDAPEWTVEPGLVPMTIAGSAYEVLLEMLDGRRQEEE